MWYAIKNSSDILVVNLWNSLLEGVVEAGSFEVFRVEVHAFMDQRIEGQGELVQKKERG